MEPLKISAKNLGAVALEDFCPRCYWIKLKLNNKLPYQSFPGIFSSIDAYTKHCVHHIISGELQPEWMQKIGHIVGWEPVPHWSKSKFLDEKTGVTLSGVPDDIWIKSDGKKVIPDFKTAKHTDAQDKLFPMYEIQANVYSLLLDREAELYLIYMEPITEAKAACENITDTGFRMRFDAVVVPVINDRRIIRAAFNLTREIFELAAPPSGRSRCKDCEALDKIIGMVSSSEKETKMINCKHSTYVLGETCERCGGVCCVDDQWKYVCKKCKKEVEPGKLVGLFVPHLCVNCETKIASSEKASGNICIMCRQPRSRCCC